MKKITFKKRIHAPAAKIWSALWDNDNYREWTSAFTEGSYAESNWNEGDEILFISPSGEGMFSIIEKMDIPTLMSFRHMGVLKDKTKQPATPETEKWIGAHENYILSENENGTDLTVEMDITEEFESYFNDMFPKALEKVRQIAER